ncbi:Gfo/Idh/MocA family protein [Propionivibrio limicola]|uniref:Gfo/Idh/MocA family protein n=1 Tax=Propionivibrio limicola TaxID=167645 RepID=UPI001290998F|nr:Gfo/Idh/MocA family oxidoreductase [Propionivibrio limicola]
MKKTVNWGVLGAAAIATKHALPAMSEAPSTTLLALASRDLAKGRAAAQALSIPRAYGSYDELLADPDIDVVYIPLPNQLHFEWSVRALEAGKHVLCEKPLCLTSAQVKELCAVRDRTGKHIEEAFAFRNHPQWAKVDEILASGALGPVRAVHGIIAKQFLDPADIRNNPAVGGGGLYDTGSYAICACNRLFRRAPTRVVAALDIDPKFGIDRLSSALLDYGDAHASFTVATQSGGTGWGTQQHLAVLCANGWLRFNFPYSQVRPTPCSVEVGNTSSVGAFPSTTFAFEPVNQFTLQAERFSRLVLGEAVPSWPIEDALDTLHTIEALFESVRSGAWQALPTR